MKNLILFIITVLGIGRATAQTLSSGNYSSSDLGYTYTVTVKQEGNVITITEPNRTNQYKSNGGNTYYHTEQKYASFYIKVVADNKYYAGKQGGGSQQLFTFSGGGSSEENVLPSGIDNCPMYDKYLNLSKTDHVNTQAWSFCGAAALAKCTYTDASAYLEPLIKALKSFMDDASKCPCEEVITKKEWEAVSNN